MNQAKEKTMEKVAADMKLDQFTSTDRVFRTTYKIGKSARPYSDLPIDVDLQVLNGVDMARTLHSDKSCASICCHIAEQIWTIVVDNILESGSKLSILVDESITISKTSVLIIYLRASLVNADEPIKIF